MTQKTSIQTFKANIPLEEAFPLVAKGGLPASYHRFSQEVIDAVVTAHNINRPLLVKGDPGLGKSQIAHAIAQCQKWNLLVHVVHSRTEPTDLLYRVDHVKRLAKAQLIGAIGNTDHKAALKQLDEDRFVVPGPLWWAYNAESAKTFYDDEQNDYQSALVQEIKQEQPSVLLIDEIDKADIELPNSLLEILNNNSFHVPTKDKTIQVDKTKRPFVVITSNDHRALPHAFLRRCVVLNLQLAEGNEGEQQLINIANAHEKDLSKISNNIVKKAAQMTIQRRENAGESEYKPGTSEFLDLLKALSRNGYEDEAEQLEAIDVISKYLLHK